MSVKHLIKRFNKRVVRSLIVNYLKGEIIRCS